MKIEWRPGIGDPTIIGWITVAAYLLASVISFHAANRAQLSGVRWRIDCHFWFLMGLLLLVLGINKQLDLQSLFTELARADAKSGGWYEQRREYQRLFIAGVAGITTVGAALLMVWSRRLWRSQQVALLGTCFLLAFIVIRAASFHHVDHFLSQVVLGARWNSILELLGIGLIGSSGLIYVSTVRGKRRRR
jgi:hypothetical protein